MARSTHFRYVLLILCLGAANLPAQQAEMIPPPIPSVLPPEPPDPDTLPVPPQLQWEPLGPKDEGGGEGAGAATALIPPAAEADPVIAAPPPPVADTPLPPDPDAMDLVKPDVEIWRGDSEWPQVPARVSNRLDKAYVAGSEPVWLRAQFNPAAAGKKILVRPGRGITVNATGAALTVSPNGECLVQAQLAEGVNRSHVIFYCEGIKTVLPVVRASLSTVILMEEETGGAH